MTTNLGPNGLTKAWRGHDGSYCITFREAAMWGPTFTIMLTPKLRLKFFYVSLGFKGHWARWHMPGSRI